LERPNSSWSMKKNVGSRPGTAFCLYREFIAVPHFSGYSYWPEISALRSSAAGDLHSICRFAQTFRALLCNKAQMVGYRGNRSYCPHDGSLHRYNSTRVEGLSESAQKVDSGFQARATHQYCLRQLKYFRPFRRWCIYLQKRHRLTSRNLGNGNDPSNCVF
jgi:hypothetical protein